MMLAKRREDYSAPDFLIPSIVLDFQLEPETTTVVNTMQVVRQRPDVPLMLDGVDLTLQQVLVNGEPFDQYTVQAESLSLAVKLDAFELTLITQCQPSKNTSLEGLYFAAGHFCTQCEAEGFRRITYALDRPDVLSEYRVSITADQAAYPQLLSNGNKVDSQVNDDGTHTVQWHDPFNKPCYLFALVAGDFDLLSGSFTTASGRDVALEMYVEKGRQQQAQHALDSLKKAMRWDEEVYGLEYDLDIYMIVATDFFNMGAMENKGLNVFNSKFVLADAATATDEDYFNIESVIAHEYFHNWTGNRVTCRDWFQLSLKEGLTVFRDQQFSELVTAPLATRIKQINLMRAQQFAEDASAMAHPIRPDEVIEMNNFYTLTVYDKGAEVIRMQHTLLGEEGFKHGIDLYFSRHDGQAVTCDDFVAAMADANSTDLSLFQRWYSQSGTPQVTVCSEYDATAQTQTYHISQMTRPTADQADKQPLVIPLAYECVDETGQQYTTEAQVRQGLCVLTEEHQAIVFNGVTEQTKVLFNLGFSAPVNVHYPEYTLADWQLLFAKAQSPLATWEAAQSVYSKLIIQHYDALLANSNAQICLDALEFLPQWLNDNQHDCELVAEVLSLPSIENLLSRLKAVDIQCLLTAREQVEQGIANLVAAVIEPLYRNISATTDTAFEYAAGPMQQRKLQNALLHYLALADGADVSNLLQQQFANATNMTIRLGALKAAQYTNSEQLPVMLAAFEATFGHDTVVMDKWFALQAMQSDDDILAKLDLLQTHPLFALNNPNKVRALVGNFAFYNHRKFHAVDGSGYRYLADFLLRFDAVNAQVAARMVTPLTQWQALAGPYQEKLIVQCRRLLDAPKLSKDVFEKVSKCVLQYEQMVNESA